MESLVLKKLSWVKIYALFFLAVSIFFTSAFLVYAVLSWAETQPAGNVDASWVAVASSSDGTHLIAAGFNGRVYLSSNSGASWAETQPAGAADKNWQTVASSADGTHLIAGINGGRLYVSSNSGGSWAETQPAGAVDQAWQATAFSSDGVNVIAGAQFGRLYLSSNSGTSWAETQPLGNVNANWFSVASSSDGTHLIAAVRTGRLYLSSNSGGSWAETQPAGNVSKLWSCVASSSDGSGLIASVNGGRLYISSNTGGSWAETQPAGNTNQAWAAVASSADGSYLIAGANGGRLYVSSNSGTSWAETQPAGNVDAGWQSLALDSNASHLVAGIYTGRIYLGLNPPANTAPSFSSGPSDGASSVSAPTNVGSNVTFTATATDPQSDNYFLAICKTNSITPNNSAAPSCGGGSWAISSRTASGVQASVTYTALEADASSNAWFAFVCDNNAASLCSATSQGSGNNGSPFIVNHAPDFSAISNTGGSLAAGAIVTFSSTASDSDSNTVTLYVCKANDFTGTACGAGGSWCVSAASASNPTCNYTILSSDTNGTHAYYANIIDSFNFASVSNYRSGIFTVLQVTGGGGGGGGGTGGGGSGGGGGGAIFLIPTPTPTPAPTPTPTLVPVAPVNPAPKPTPTVILTPAPSPIVTPRPTPSQIPPPTSTPLLSPVVTPISSPAPANVVIQNPPSFPSDNSGFSVLAFFDMAKKSLDFLKNPLGLAITAIVSGAVAMATVITLATSFSWGTSLVEIALNPFKWGSLIMFGLGIKKRSKPWGVVYDSVTKQPLDPAYVILQNKKSEEKYDAITDLDGRYGFLAEPDVYHIIPQKTHYVFPSKKLAGQTSDELYDNLYFGNEIEIKERGDVIAKNIPMDPVGFDWNEFAKRNMKVMKFYSKWDLLLRKISDQFFMLGLAVSIIAFIVTPSLFNSLILGLYVVLAFLRAIGIKPKSFGYVVDAITGSPLSFAILRIIRPKMQQEIGHRVTDKYGRYFCLVPQGRYQIKIEKKNTDGSYSPAYTSPIVDTSKTGIIKKKFKV